MRPPKDLSPADQTTLVWLGKNTRLVRKSKQKKFFLLCKVAKWEPGKFTQRCSSRNVGLFAGFKSS